MKNITKTILQCPAGSVWTASENDQFCAAGRSLSVCPTGYGALDAALPDGGWASSQIQEILHGPMAGADVPLVAPALVRRQREAMQGAQSPWAGTVVLVNPVHTPFTPAWGAWGLDASRLVWLHPERPQACAWAVEQALQCSDVVAVLAWLPQAHALALRRIQYLASKSEVMLWVFRPQMCRTQSSPAPLRLIADVDASDMHQPALSVEVLKRRGQPHAGVMRLTWQHHALGAALKAQRQWVNQRRQEALEWQDEYRALDGVAAVKQAA